MQRNEVVLVLGSGPDAPDAATWPRSCIDRIVAINNAWRVRRDWDHLIFPEDFPDERKPGILRGRQNFVQADSFVTAQNAYGGFVFAGGTMAFTAAYWALYTLRPRVLAFFGCDMVYPETGKTNFYGTGSPDPLRNDVTLQDLGAKSARLGLLAARQGCACVNLSAAAETTLLFRRARLRDLPVAARFSRDCDAAVADLLDRERALGYEVPSGRYWEYCERFDPAELALLDAGWRSAWALTERSANAA